MKSWTIHAGLLLVVLLITLVERSADCLVVMAAFRPKHMSIAGGRWTPQYRQQREQQKRPRTGGALAAKKMRAAGAINRDSNAEHVGLGVGFDFGTRYEMDIFGKCSDSVCVEVHHLAFLRGSFGLTLFSLYSRSCFDCGLLLLLDATSTTTGSAVSPAPVCIRERAIVLQYIIVHVRNEDGIERVDTNRVGMIHQSLMCMTKEADER